MVMSHDAASLKHALPYARRYARALVASQAEGDHLVAQALRRGLPDLPARLALYQGISRCDAAGHDGCGEAGLSPVQRRLLLLTTLEELTLAEAAAVLDLAVAEAEAVLESAREELRRVTTTDVLIIEDEPIIAMDLHMLVAGCGHRVVGVVGSEAEAVRVAREERPGLILADVNLGFGGDGCNAVRRILENMDAPVIFVTAYPERLLTAEGLEPAFVITKPFDRLSLAIATYQATTSGRVPIV